MGILNITPDSFSDGGFYNSTELAIKRASQLIIDGADILDIGGESTRPGASQISIKEELNIEPEISTDGGTSDGRFMAKICDQVIEFGLINESIHKINEHTTSASLDAVTKIYTSMLNRLLVSK